MDVSVIIGIAAALILIVGLATYTGAKKSGAKKEGTNAAVVAQTAVP